MKRYEKSLYDLHGIVSFASLNIKLIDRYKGISNREYTKFSTYLMISLNHSLIVYIGILFDKTKGTNSLYKYKEYINNKKIDLYEKLNWIILFNKTYPLAQPILRLRNKFHAHKSNSFDVFDYWETNPKAFDNIPIIIENSKKLINILSTELLDFELDFDSTNKELLKQYDLYHKEKC